MIKSPILIGGPCHGLKIGMPDDRTSVELANPMSRSGQIVRYVKLNYVLGDYIFPIWVHDGVKMMENEVLPLIVSHLTGDPLSNFHYLEQS